MRKVLWFLIPLMFLAMPAFAADAIITYEYPTTELSRVSSFKVFTATTADGSFAEVADCGKELECTVANVSTEVMYYRVQAVGTDNNGRDITSGLSQAMVTPPIPLQVPGTIEIKVIITLGQ